MSVRLLRGLDRRKAVYEEQAKGGLYDVKVTKGTLVRLSTYVHVKVLPGSNNLASTRDEASNPLGCHK